MDAGHDFAAEGFQQNLDVNVRTSDHGSGGSNGVPVVVGQQ